MAEARAFVLANCRTPVAAGPVPLADSLGRVLAADITCREGLPRFATALMDGYALRAGRSGVKSCNVHPGVALQDLTPLAVTPLAAARLPLVGEARAGVPYTERLAPGTAVAISTGAPLPAGADAVVPLERASEDGGDVVLDDPAAIEAGAHVLAAGAQLAPGAVAVAHGTALGPDEIGLLAACGAEAPLCHTRPAVAIVTTGDELVPPGEVELLPGQVRDANAPLLAALAREAGAAVVHAERVPDDPEATRAALARALAGADLVLACGGISVGCHDHVGPALAALGVAEVVRGVAIRPGRVSRFGTHGRRLVFGLPGKPASARVAFELLVRPALDALQGRAPREPRPGVAFEELGAAHAR